MKGGASAPKAPPPPPPPPPWIRPWQCLCFYTFAVVWCALQRKMPKTRYKKKQPNPYDASEATVKQLTVTRADDDAEDNCTCSQCSKSVEQMLECECCEQWYCCACQNVGDKMFAVLDEFKSLHWFCAKCEPTILQRPKDATSPQVNPQGQQCEIESRLKALESQLTSLTDSLSKITKSCSVVDAPQAINVTSNVTAPDVLALGS